MRDSLSPYLGLVLVVLTNLTFCSAQDDAVCHANGTFTCGHDDLNHSVLIECDATVCSGGEIITENHSIDWPLQPGQIIQVQSSRAGARLVQTNLPNLDYVEDDEARMLDINTTLYIDTKRPDHGEHRDLIGFGATIDFFDLDEALRENKFDRLFGPIFAGLFSKTRHGANFNLMRLLVHPAADTSIDLLAVLLKLDDELTKQPYVLNNKLKIVVEAYNRAPYRLQFTVSKPIKTLAYLDIWALADETGSTFKDIRHDLPDALLLRSVELDGVLDLLDGTNVPSLKNTQGLLIKSKPSTPYELLQKTRNLTGPKMRILTVGRSFPKPTSLGDWQNAQDSSIELMNLLSYGSDGYIEDRSVTDILRDIKINSDASLYSLHNDHGFHLRGPKFYTTAHFSRYLKTGSQQLKTELFTQPNMFAAHYSAFMSPDSRHVICVVSNENEHLLPLRLAIDRRIKTLVYVEPKSINTFLINLA